MILRVLPTLCMTLRCLSGDGTGDGGDDDDGLAQLDGDGEGDMSDKEPMTSEESGDEFGSLPDESGDMKGEEEDKVSRRGKQPLKIAISLEFLFAVEELVLESSPTIHSVACLKLCRDCTRNTSP